MAYRKSRHRVEFNEKVDYLINNSKIVDKCKNKGFPDICTLVYYCAIFQTCAAKEVYLKSLIESWAFKLNSKNMGNIIPQASRAYLAKIRLDKPFAQYRYQGDEREIINSVQNEHELWQLMVGEKKLPQFFSGVAFHEGSSYPTFRNIKRLFMRVGIPDMAFKLNAKLKRDVEIMISGFQDIRTAIAHSQPPSITLMDVNRLLSDAKALVGAIDRIFYGHVIRHGGSGCWD